MGVDKITHIAYINTCAELPVELQGTLKILAKATKARFSNFEPLVIEKSPAVQDR
jgi:hypothetical protein